MLEIRAQLGLVLTRAVVETYDENCTIYSPVTLQISLEGAAGTSHLGSHNLLTMSYTLYGVIIGDTDAFNLKVDQTWTMSALRDHIKEKAAQMLASIHAHHLTLYKANIDISSEEAYIQVMKAISQNATWAEALQDIPLQYTNNTQVERIILPSRRLSAIFDEPTLDEDNVRIVVELPPGESSDSRAYGAVAETHLPISLCPRLHYPSNGAPIVNYCAPSTS